jgi:hypothetical protein
MLKKWDRYLLYICGSCERIKLLHATRIRDKAFIQPYLTEHLLDRGEYGITCSLSAIKFGIILNSLLAFYRY